MSSFSFHRSCRALLLACGVSAAACVGHVRGENVPGEPGASATPGAPQGDGAGASGGAVEPATCVVEAQRVAERLLTRDQLAFAIEDIFAELGADGAELVTSVPPSTRVGGFAANADAAVDKLTLNAFIETADATARLVSSRFAELDVGCREGRSCAQTFVQRFGRRAFRRTLEASEVESLLAQLFDPEPDFSVGIQQLVRGLLLAADFLYEYEVPPKARDGAFAVSDVDFASRLGFLFWDSVPDEQLLSLAESGQLRVDGNLERQLERLRADSRFDRVLRRFSIEWLTKGNRAEKSEALFPELDPAVRAMAAEELGRFVSRVTRGGGRLADLFTSTSAELTPSLATLYGSTLPVAQEKGWQAAELPSAERAGILTRLGFLLETPAETRTSPTIRGRYLLGALFCRDVQPPPPELQGFVTVQDDPSKSLRQRMTETTSQLPACSGCHVQMDPIGFAFEHYDAIGRYRTQDGAVAIDAATQVLGVGDVRDALDLSARLADSPEVRECYVRNWYRFALHKVESSADECGVQKLTAAFVAGGMSLSALITEIAKSPMLTLRPAPTTQAAP